MKFAILSRNGKLYSTRRLVEAARERGHSVRVLDPLRCYMRISSAGFDMRYKGKPTEQALIRAVKQERRALSIAGGSEEFLAFVESCRGGVGEGQDGELSGFGVVREDRDQRAGVGDRARDDGHVGAHAARHRERGVDVGNHGDVVAAGQQETLDEQRAVAVAGRPAVMVEGQAEPGGQGGLFGMHPGAVIGHGLARLGRGQFGGGAVFVGGADEHHLMPHRAVEAGEEVGRQLGADEVPEMLDPVDVGNGRGDQDACHVCAFA